MLQCLKHMLFEQFHIQSISNARRIAPNNLNNLYFIDQKRFRNYGTNAVYKINTPFALHRLDEGPPTEAPLTTEEALKFYKEMNLIRRMETAASILYQQKYARGFLHLYSGQEAIAVGYHSSMRPQDVTIAAYRCHGWAYLCGSTIEEILSELSGRVNGSQRGKGGSMHMYNKRMFGGNGIVGDHVPVGTGISFGYKYAEKDKICTTSYGDGASNQGQIAEAFNMAKLWNIPSIYLCENNIYGYSTKMNRSSANTQYYTRGDLIPGVKCDGMDVVAMREVSKFALEYVLKTSSPIILEAVTYRYFGHSMSDPGTAYRTKEEVDEVRKNRDCITTFKDKIKALNLVTDDDLKSIDEAIKAEVDKAAEIAKAGKPAEDHELGYDVYANSLTGTTRNNLYWHPLEHKNMRIDKAFNMK